MNDISSTKIRGIDEPKLDKLIIDIYDYADRIKRLLNEVDDLVLETSNFYYCNEADEFRKKFEVLKSSFPSVNRNIISYAEDLISAKLKFNNIDRDLSDKTNLAKQVISNSTVERYVEKV